MQCSKMKCGNMSQDILSLNDWLDKCCFLLLQRFKHRLKKVPLNNRIGSNVNSIGMVRQR